MTIAPDLYGFLLYSTFLQPSLWLELFCIGTPKADRSVYSADGDRDGLACGDRDTVNCFTVSSLDGNAEWNYVILRGLVVMISAWHFSW
jgi:hypothetical protein